MPVTLVTWRLRSGRSQLEVTPNSSRPPISKVTIAKMGYRCGSSSRAPALQAPSTGFKPQSHLKKKKKKKTTLANAQFRKTYSK
jgi:hypothetical protein